MRCADAIAQGPSRAGREARRLPGLTLVEAVVSIVVVGLMLVAGLSAVGASRRTQYLMATRTRGQLLAQGLMSEILAQRYQEPDDPPLFGLEGGELPITRADWDDVDDYRNWSSSPPQSKAGSAIAGLSGWTRSVTVEHVTVIDLTQVSAVETGAKRITVTVWQGDRVVGSAVAVRTEAWPDGDDRLQVLFVVTDRSSLTEQEQARQALMESWGFRVTLIRTSASQSQVDAAIVQAEVAYVCEEVYASYLGTKLREKTIGVVNEDAEMVDEFGFCQSTSAVDRDMVKIVDNTSYITSGFPTGYLTVFSSPQPVYLLQAEYAPGLGVLSEYFDAGDEANNKPSLAVLAPGAPLYGGGVAMGRRVQLPWGGDAFDIASLNRGGKTLMRRAIEWAAGWQEIP
ncbi:MAG TPA: hypothetical protein VM243_13810 [Phycisphaerae bacterium]|nr:hypothetical protein [Phycisphaerae bacterium]